jgi:potassium-dependent mechanosensitive channel
MTRFQRFVRDLCTGALLVCALLGASHAQTDTTDSALDEIRRQIDAAQKSLKNSDAIGDTELQAMRSGALAAQSRAAGIANQLAPQIGALDARVTELGTPQPGAKEDPDIANQRTLLTKSRGALDAQVKLARLLALENGQLAEQLRTLRRSEFQARLGERTRSVLATSFWVELRDELPRDWQRLATLGNEITAAAHDTPASVWLLAPLVAAAALWSLSRLKRSPLHWLTTHAPAGRVRRSVYALVVVVQWTLAFGIVATALEAMLDWKGSLSPPNEVLLAFGASRLWFTGFVYGLAKALLSARRPTWRLLPIPDAVATATRGFPALIAFAGLATGLAERLAVAVNASLALTVAINCGVALAMGLTMVLALMRGERVWRVELAKDGAHARPTWLAIAAGLNWLVLATAVVCLLAGYVAFGSFAIKQVVWAAILLGAVYLLGALIDDALMAWLAAGHRDAEGKPQQPATPAGSRASAQVAVLASGLLRLALLLLAVMLLLVPFGEGPSELLRRSGPWRQSLSIGEFKLEPIAVLQALIVLVVGVGVVRGLRRWLTDRYLPTTSLDPGMRASTTSLFGYAGIVIAIAVAMSAMGIGLERIAWVASALSVGIGFGLQAVVQNFVSGLILLAERPVKVGDLVSLGGIEGDIRRINVRATEIQMGDRSTVIVPNSEFITKIVRNVTLADPLGLVQVKLPVPLGSDANQVRELLLAAFEANTDVLDTPAPNVLLDGIEHGQLLFNATGFAKSPRVTGNVRSALLFDMLLRLKEVGITLSAPPTMLMNAPVVPAAPEMPPADARPAGT